LNGLRSGWNVSLWHYRNYGGDMGKVLAGIQVPPDQSEQFEKFLRDLHYPFTEETNNPVYTQFFKQ
jgi:threonine dehydratase